jgi:hypothetical protein
VLDSSNPERDLRENRYAPFRIPLLSMARSSGIRQHVPGFGKRIVRREKPVPIFSPDALEHVPEKWTRFSDKDMLPKFLNWREFFSIR